MELDDCLKPCPPNWRGDTIAMRTIRALNSACRQMTRIWWITRAGDSCRFPSEGVKKLVRNQKHVV